MRRLAVKTAPEGSAATKPAVAGFSQFTLASATCGVGSGKSVQADFVAERSEVI